MKLKSKVFKDKENIPDKYTCKGDNISPPLEWEGLPEATESLALVLEDPDSPGKTFIHWILYNMSPDISELPEAVMKERELANGGLQGKNDFGNIGYGGPCPQSGEHNYMFQLHALDQKIDVPPAASIDKVYQAINGHIIETAQLMGKFSKGT